MKFSVDGQPVTGQFAVYAAKALAGKDYYQDYMARKISNGQFEQAMAADAALGFNEYNVRHVSLTPQDERMPAEHIFGELEAAGLIPGGGGMYDGFGEFRQYVLENYNHGEFVTFVYPEDELLLYAAAKLVRPARMFMAGSYYGYLAVWAMQAVRDMQGCAVLCDVDGEVCELARENFNRLGFGDCAQILCEDAGAVLARRTEPIDLLVLDATGRHDDERPDFRGKRIYGALLNAAKHLLHKGSVIYIHNMEPDSADMRGLVDGLREINARGASYDTYNGLGVYIVS